MSLSTRGHQQKRLTINYDRAVMATQSRDRMLCGKQYLGAKETAAKRTACLKKQAIPRYLPSRAPGLLRIASSHHLVALCLSLKFIRTIRLPFLRRNARDDWY